MEKIALPIRLYFQFWKVFIRFTLEKCAKNPWSGACRNYTRLFKKQMLVSAVWRKFLYPFRVWFLYVYRMYSSICRSGAYMPRKSIVCRWTGITVFNHRFGVERRIHWNSEASFLKIAKAPKARSFRRFSIIIILLQTVQPCRMQSLPPHLA